MRKITHSEKETFNFAAAWAKKLTGGEVLALSGDLGAGKTAFAKGLAAGLGIKRTINSPTFVLMKVYPVSMGDGSRIRHFVHVDAYRVAGPEALVGIGLEDYIGSPDAVVAIEWAERVEELVPHGALRVNLGHAAGGRRVISWSGVDKRS